jgi:hypothetical protein
MNIPPDERLCIDCPHMIISPKVVVSEPLSEETMYANSEFKCNVGKWDGSTATLSGGHNLRVHMMQAHDCDDFVEGA